MYSGVTTTCSRDRCVRFVLSYRVPYSLSCSARYRVSYSVPYSVSQLIAALEYPKRQGAQRAAGPGNDREAQARLNVGKPEKAVAKTVDHIEERIEMRQRLPERRQGVDRVENARQERQRHDQEILKRGELVELVRPDAGKEPEHAEDHAAEQGKCERPQRMHRRDRGEPQGDQEHAQTDG